MSRARPVHPGVPAAGHVAFGAWHPGQVEGCPKCPSDSAGRCQWWALCENPATGTMAHPVLGQVPICDRCRAKVQRIKAANQSRDMASAHAEGLHDELPREFCPECGGQRRR